MSTISLAKLLPHGSLQLIAHKLGIGKQAVSKALKSQRPGHPAVIEAMRIARDSGALEAAQELQRVQSPPSSRPAADAPASPFSRR